MITLEQYFGTKDHTDEQEQAATDLLYRVNQLVNEAVEGVGFKWDPNPHTGCCISGSIGGSGDGGFRTPESTTGAPHSSHREARAVDVYDPDQRLDNWLTTFETLNSGGNSKLLEYDLYREAPHSTPGWVHLTTRRPGSGRRTFAP